MSTDTILAALIAILVVGSVFGGSQLKRLGMVLRKVAMRRRARDARATR
jgi:hypothetical protein